DVFPRGLIPCRRENRGRHRDARRRAVLRDGARWHVDVQIAMFQEVFGDAELGRVSADVTDSGTGRLLHDVAELTRETDVLAPPRQQRRLDEEDVAAGFGPRDARGYAGA